MRWVAWRPRRAPPCVRGVALGLQPRELVVADDREVETGFLGEGDLAHQLFGGPPARTSSCSRSGSWRSFLLFERARHDGQVLLTEPLINGLLPFAGQAGKDGEPFAVGRLQGEVHV